MPMSFQSHGSVESSLDSHTARRPSLATTGIGHIPHPSLFTLSGHPGHQSVQSLRVHGKGVDQSANLQWLAHSPQRAPPADVANIRKTRRSPILRGCTGRTVYQPFLFLGISLLL